MLSLRTHPPVAVLASLLMLFASATAGFAEVGAERAGTPGEASIVPPGDDRGALASPALTSTGGLLPEAQQAILEEFGVEVVGLRLTAGGHMLDFRYRVHDAEKAAPLHGPRIKPVVFDLATKQELGVPRPPKIGPLKQTRAAPVEDRVYVILFANPGDTVRPGGAVSIKLGGLTIDRIVAQ